MGVDDPTYEQDMAPLIARRCLPCHVEGGPAPFPLQTFEQVKRKGDLIRWVTIVGTMPPTDAVSDLARMTANAPLTDEDRILIQDWVRSGKGRGSAAHAHPPEIPVATWSLDHPTAQWSGGTGERTLADGPPYRKLFLIANPVHEEVSLTQFALTPAVPLALRQAYVSVVPKGFEGDIQREFFGPTGMKGDALVGAWASGYSAWRSSTGVRLHPGDRLAVWALIQPTGKEEDAGFKLDVITHAASQTAATWHTFADDTFSIRPGDGLTTVRASWTLNEERAVTSLIPECRSFARQVRVRAEFPDGSVKQVLTIVSWDANWVGAYQPDKPIRLPAGTKLTAEIDYDNSGHSAGNRESKPTKPVLPGPTDKDELFRVHIQTEAVSAETRRTMRP